MSLLALDGTPFQIGAAHRQGIPSLTALTNTTMAVTGNVYYMTGRIFTEDKGSHTIDTSGSSSIGWLTNSITYANAGSSFMVGIGAVDATNGPPVRMVNVADVPTFDVSKTIAGASGLIANGGWNEHVPDTGTKTIAHGDLVSIGFYFATRAGADSIQIRIEATLAATGRPSNTLFQSAAYTDRQALPNVVITFSDGKLGWFQGGFVCSTTPTTIAWNNTSTLKEYGNLFKFPVPTTIYGIYGAPLVTGDFDFVLYSDGLGTPVSEKTASIDVNQVGLATIAVVEGLFATPYDLPANTEIVAAYKPTSATNISALHITMNSSAHQKTWPGGINCYAVNRNAAAFSAQNSSKDRFNIGLLIGGLDDGVGSITGYPASRLSGGM